MKTEEILNKIEKLNDWEIRNFIFSLDLTPEQMEILADHEDRWVRWGLAEHTTLAEDLMIMLSSDVYGNAGDKAFKKLRELKSLSSEDLESAYDLIRKSKHIGRRHFEITFDFIIYKFPELKKLAEMFKRIILKGKKDLK